MPPGVDHAFFSPGQSPWRARTALGLRPTRPVLLFVGRIQPLKGLDVAVRALAALRPAATRVLVVVGGPSGAEGDAYVAEVARSMAATLGVADRVALRAAAAAPSALQLLPRRRRVPGAQPVRVASGSSRSRRPPAALPSSRAAVGGLRTLVDHGHTGFLVEGRDPERVRRRTRTSCSTNGVLAAEMSAAAAARAGGYTWSMSAARLRRLYADLTVGALVECS